MTSIRVSLSEVLEVRNGPLVEAEAWALLQCGTVALQHLMKKGHFFKPLYAVIPDTLLLCWNGRIQLAPKPSFHDVLFSHQRHFVPHECYALSGNVNLDSEKVYVFGLGMTLYAALCSEKNSFSDQILSTLGAMCSDDITMRLNLHDVLLACNNVGLQYHTCCSTVRRLYRSILGSSSSPDVSDASEESDSFVEEIHTVGRSEIKHYSYGLHETELVALDTENEVSSRPFRSSEVENYQRRLSPTTTNNTQLRSADVSSGTAAGEVVVVEMNDSARLVPSLPAIEDRNTRSELVQPVQEGPFGFSSQSSRQNETPTDSSPMPDQVSLSSGASRPAEQRYVAVVDMPSEIAVSPQDMVESNSVILGEPGEVALQDEIDSLAVTATTQSVFQRTDGFQENRAAATGNLPLAANSLQNSINSTSAIVQLSEQNVSLLGSLDPPSTSSQQFRSTSASSPEHNINVVAVDSVVRSAYMSSHNGTSETIPSSPPPSPTRSVSLSGITSTHHANSPTSLHYRSNSQSPSLSTSSDAIHDPSRKDLLPSAAIELSDSFAIAGGKVSGSLASVDDTMINKIASARKRASVDNLSQVTRVNASVTNNAEVQTLRIAHQTVLNRKSSDVKLVRKVSCGPEFLRLDKNITLFLPEAGVAFQSLCTVPAARLGMRGRYRRQSMDRWSPLLMRAPRAMEVSTLRHVEVVLLNGIHLDVVCHVDICGRQLFDFLVTHLMLPEPAFFGLTFMHAGEHVFIESDTKLHKVAPAEWKTCTAKGCRQSANFVVYLRFKFFVDDISLLRQPVTRHLLYLQLRQEIISERLPCSDEVATTLAGLALTAEYNLCTADSLSEANLDHYVSQQLLNHVHHHQLQQLISLKLMQCSGLNQTEAELRFVEVAMKIPEYGLHFYQLNKKNAKSEPVWLGIGLNGVLIAERRGDSVLVVSESFAWQNLEKISFGQHRFSLSPKNDTGQGKKIKFNYYTESYKKGKYLLGLCTEHHHFLLTTRMTKMLNPASDGDLVVSLEQSTASLYSGSTNGFVFSTEDVNHDDEYDGNLTMSSQSSVYVQPVPSSLTAISGVHITTPRTTKFHSMPHFNGQSEIDSSEGKLEKFAADEIGTLNDERAAFQSNGNISSTTSVPEVETASSGLMLTKFKRSRGKQSASVPDVTAAYSQSHRVINVELRKLTADSGFGFGIARDQTMQPCLLSVAQLVPGGVAERDGLLLAGDKIVEMNGQSMVGLSQRAAVDLVQTAGNVLRLVVLRSGSDDNSAGSGITKSSNYGMSTGVSQLKPLQSLAKPSADVQMELSVEWFDSVPLISPARSPLVKYSGTQLESIVQHLQGRLARDDTSQEFKSLKQIRQSDGFTEALKAANKSKNRYRNVLPYDSSRVRLPMEGADYINASYVSYPVTANSELQGDEDVVKNCLYIATQDPLSSTVADYWTMIWDQRVTTVVSLTNANVTATALSEDAAAVGNGGSASSLTIPNDISRPLVIDKRFQLILTKQQCLQDVEVSWLQLSDFTSPESSRIVTYLHYMSWPEHGVPSSSLALLKLRRLMHVVRRDETIPIVIHCMAGIGPTGVLITIDIALTLIEHDVMPPLELQQIVGTLRRQRAGMVQTNAQYRLCYDAVLTSLMSILSSSSRF